MDRADYPALPGSALLEMNGRPFKEFIAPITDRISGETPQFRASVFCGNQAFWWDFSGLLASSPEIDMKVRDRTGKVLSKKLSAVTAWDFRRFPPPDSDPWRVLYDKKGVSWINFRPMTYSRAERKAWDALFRELKQAGTTALVIDISRNGGGTPA